MMKTILISGSSGFIGKYLVKSLSELPFRIIRLDIEDGIDLTLSSHIKSINKGADVVVHLAAKSFVPASFEQPQSFYFNNIISTLNLLEYCRKNNSTFIFFSSYLYGNPDYLPINEKHSLKPHNPYAQTKLIGEELCKAYHRDFHVPVVILRPFNIYGYGQDDHFLIPTIIKQILTKDSIILKDPRPKRDYIYIDDIVTAVQQIVESNLKGINIFNLGSGQSHSIGDLVDILKYIVNKPVEVQFTNEIRKNEVLDTVADISLIFNKIGWKPSTTIKEGLERLIKNYIK